MRHDPFRHRRGVSVFLAVALMAASPVAGSAKSGRVAPAARGGAVDAHHAAARAGAPTPPSGCGGYVGYTQPFSTIGYEWGYTADLGWLSFWSAEASVNGSGVIVPMGAGAIDKLRWWGVSDIYDWDLGDFAGTYCDVDDMANVPYYVTFFADEGGQPGEPLARRTVVPTYFLTDACWDCGALDSFVAEYEAEISPPADATQVAWIGLARGWGGDLPDGNECAFLWVEAVTPYDGMSSQMWLGDGAWVAQSDDLSYCVDKAAPQASYTDIFYGDFEKGDLRYWSGSVPA